MTITPNGAPAWLRTASLASYDGDLNKKNYLSLGVVDPLTDVGAEGFSRIVADLAAVVRVSAFCEMSISCMDSTTLVPIVNSASLMSGITTASYVGNAPPTGFPTVSRVSDGVVLITFASSYLDLYGVSGAFSVLMPMASVLTVAGTATIVATATTAQVAGFSTAGAALADPTLRFSCLSGT